MRRSTTCSDEVRYRHDEEKHRHEEEPDRVTFLRRRHASNENKMSDGGRGRSSLKVETWKSSQDVDVERSDVRSIAWLDDRRRHACQRKPTGKQIDATVAMACTDCPQLKATESNAIQSCVSAA